MKLGLKHIIIGLSFVFNLVTASEIIHLSKSNSPGNPIISSTSSVMHSQKVVNHPLPLDDATRSLLSSFGFPDNFDPNTLKYYPPATDRKNMRRIPLTNKEKTKVMETRDFLLAYGIAAPAMMDEELLYRLSHSRDT